MNWAKVENCCFVRRVTQLFWSWVVLYKRQWNVKDVCISSGKVEPEAVELWEIAGILSFRDALSNLLIFFLNCLV